MTTLYNVSDRYCSVSDKVGTKTERVIFVYKLTYLLIPFPGHFLPTFWISHQGCSPDGSVLSDLSEPVDDSHRWVRGPGTPKRGEEGHGCRSSERFQVGLRLRGPERSVARYFPLTFIERRRNLFSLPTSYRGLSPWWSVPFRLHKE